MPNQDPAVMRAVLQRILQSRRKRPPTRFDGQGPDDFRRFRMAQLQEIAPLIPGMAEALHGISGPNERELAVHTPRQDFREATAYFGNVARERGIADPRKLLQQLLRARAGRVGGGVMYPPS